jgi:hypothetical protein
MEIGDRYFLTENTRVLLGHDDGIIYTVVDILKLEVESPIVINAEEFGKDWVEFVNEDELIKLEEHPTVKENVRKNTERVKALIDACETQEDVRNVIKGELSRITDMAIEMSVEEEDYEKAQKLKNLKDKKE